MISYSQNFEDVLLWRTLKHVEKGFYIDVGANDPVADSVTKVFYDAGWTGINVEPIQQWFTRLEEQRPNDINLNVAAGARTGEITIYELSGTGLSTSILDIAERHVNESNYQKIEHKVTVRTLTDICEEYKPLNIHFLKVDVEGAEKQVIEGIDFSKIRPWIIVLESTLPNTRIESYGDWEPILLAVDYECVYFDGLNRFYLAKEYQEIKSNLIVPPNVFDNVFLSGNASSTFHSQIAQVQCSLAESKAQQQSQKAILKDTERKCQLLEMQLQTIEEGVDSDGELLSGGEITQIKLIKTLNEIKKQIDNSQVSSNDAKEQRRILEGSLKTSVEERLHLESQLQVIQMQVVQREEKLQEKDVALQKSEWCHQQLELQLKKLQVHSGQRDEQLCEKELALQKSEWCHQQLELQLKKLQVHSGQRDEQLCEKELALQKSEWCYQQLELQLKKLQVHSEQRDEQLSEKKLALQKSERCYEQLEIQLQALQVHNRQLEEQLNEKEVKLEEITLSLQDIKQKMADLQHSSLLDSQNQRQLFTTSLADKEREYQQQVTQVQILQVEIRQRDKRLRENEDKLQEVSLTLGDSKQQIDKLHAYLVDSKDQRLALEVSLQGGEQQRQQLERQLQAQIDQVQALMDQGDKNLSEKDDCINRLNNELNAVYTSKSWRITLPLRKLLDFVVWLYYQLKQFTLWFILLPKRVVYWLLVKTMAVTLKRPNLSAQIIARLSSKYPNYYSRLREIAKAQGLIEIQPNNSSSSSLPNHPELDNCEPELVDIGYKTSPLEGDLPLTLPLASGERVIYLFVDHTVSFPTSTGVQRVTRGLAASLTCLGECIRYVKWDAVNNQCTLIDKSEREHLARWNGPSIKTFELELYRSDNGSPPLVEPHILDENHWLIVPEVTHITCQKHPVTLDLLQWSRRSGLRVGFIFYDAIPLRRKDLHETAPKHAKYMQELLLADVVWSISKWSADDLIAFWIKNECATEETIPEVDVLQLPGESSLCARVVTPQATEKLILSVGSVEPRKNQIKLIKAFEAYRKLHPDSEWRLTLVGNLHPIVAEEVHHAQCADAAIKHVGHVSDHELDSLYRSCAFTVFPSVEEGFGLPILESLWYGKPCVCANFGSMAEVASPGGCLMVDTRDQKRLTEAIIHLIEDSELRHSLEIQAVSRAISTWSDYGTGILSRVEKERHPETSLGRVYCWIDATLQFSKNTGIQRVSRQLSRGLIEQGVGLVPVKWDSSRGKFGPVSKKELEFFAQWNGPDEMLWQDWVEPEASRQSDWFLMPDLPLNLSTIERAKLLEYTRESGLKCATIFYDTIPWKMRDIYPSHIAQSVREYMISLAEHDLILPISAFVREDLIDFLGASLLRPQGLDMKIKSVILPGEFPENKRVSQVLPRTAARHILILCVGTVEPRKNHEVLLQAFALAEQRSTKSAKLVLVGGSHSIEPALADRVRDLVSSHPCITWEEHADDVRLHELHVECDFTIYPSVEEGFGLPILESLWYSKPCICANHGAMREAAEGGGCLMINVRNIEEMAEALHRMIDDPTLCEDLAREVEDRSFKSWQDYALEVTMQMERATSVPYAGKLLMTHSEFAAHAQKFHLAPRPKLSVCISTYNRAEWLSTSLKNWSQLYPVPLPEVEFLVCDNASTDHTSQVVKPYLERADFSYHCNAYNVGMLGNLRETAHNARGEYIWIVGDDDLLMPDSIERVLDTLHAHLNLALVYLNYSYTRIEDARTLIDFDTFFREATPIVSAESDLQGPIRAICARNENFFTAIYTLVFRRDHALKAYSQDTSGRPFSTMLTCIPTTYYVLNYMMDEPGVWIGSPQLVVNMNVSWLKYAPLWILERIPEVYEIAEQRGVLVDEVDRWRRHTVPGVAHYFRDIFEADPLNNADFFLPARLVRRFKHLPEFTAICAELCEIYSQAHAKAHPAAKLPISHVFPELMLV